MSRSFGFISIPLTWTRISEYSEGIGIYLCDQIVVTMLFDEESNNWDGSKVKHWLNSEFYRDSFSKEQREKIVYHTESKSRVFLLSSEEYEKNRENIPLLRTFWWLRSPGYYASYAAIVDCHGDLLDYGYCVDNNLCVRPAILLSE